MGQSFPFGRGDEIPDHELIHPNLIQQVNVLQGHEAQERRWMSIVHGWINIHNARFVVDKLERLLLQELVAGNVHPHQRTGLSLQCRPFSNGAMEVFSGFLRRTSNLTALVLFSPPRNLLQALHDTRTCSVTELHISTSPFSCVRAQEQLGGSIVELLQHNTNFEGFVLFGFHIERHVHILPFLRRGFPHLRKLSLETCFIGDDHFESILDALVYGNHHSRLKELSFDMNRITPQGVATFLLDSFTFSCLEKLNLGCNAGILDDIAITRRFVQKILLTEGTVLKELYIAFCRPPPMAYAIILKALETNRMLRLLDISDFDEYDQQYAIREHLIESLPKIKGLRHLILKDDLFLAHPRDHELTMAFRRNTSLFKVSTCNSGVVEIPGAPLPWDHAPDFLCPILKRNKQLAYIDEQLLGGGATTATTATTARGRQNDITIPRGQWARVLAEVGQGSEGSSPVFQILQTALASWVESSKNTKQISRKRKRMDA